MMRIALIAVLFVSATQAGDSNKEQEINEIANRDLDKFKTAARNGDLQETSKLMRDQLLPLIQASQLDDKKFSKYYKEMAGALGLAADRSNTIDGQRLSAGIQREIDNLDKHLSVERLKAANQWIEKRKSSSSGQLAINLERAQEAIIDIKRKSDSLVKTFKYDMDEAALKSKKIKENANQLKKISELMSYNSVRIYDYNKSFYQEAIDRVMKAIDNDQSGSLNVGQP